MKQQQYQQMSEDKNVDEFQIGVSMGLGESGRIGFAHISHDTAVDMKQKSNFIAGQYTIGSMTAYLGVAQHKTENNTGAPADRTGLGNPGEATNLVQLRSQKDATTFAGIRGSVGDTGLTYLFQARSKKSKGTNDVYTSQADGTEDTTSKVAANKHTPWMMGLYRSLGGGATVMFEHGNPDQTGMKSTSHLALRIDF